MKDVTACACCWLAALLPWAMAGDAVAALAAAGDGAGMWIVRSPDQQSLTILYRAGGTGERDLRPIGPALRGQLAPRGLAAAEGRLWLVYHDLTVQSIEPVMIEAIGQLQFVPRTAPPLPRGVTPRGLAAAAGRTWALVRVENAHVLAAIEAPLADESAALAAAEPGDEEPAPQPDADPPPPPRLPVDRLLALSGHDWRKMELPEDWPHGATAWLVAARRDEAPQLLTLHADLGQPRLVRYRFTAGGWVSQAFTLPAPGPVQVAAVGAHVVLAIHEQQQQQALHLRICLLRDDVLNELGAMRIEKEGVVRHVLLDAGGQYPVGVLTWTEDEQFALTQMDWQERTVGPTPLVQRAAPTLTFPLEMIVLLTALVLATLMMLALWRRDVPWSVLDLPANLALADLSRRALAGAIDVAPCIAAATLLLDLDGRQWEVFWPTYRHDAWADLLPRAAIIGAFCAHTFLTELFTARTLGKYVTGLRVTDLKGQPPNIWQVLVRNLMKVFELVALPLLVLPAIAPYRQRLGDMAARTVVVMEAAREQSPPDIDEEAE